VLFRSIDTTNAGRRNRQPECDLFHIQPQRAAWSKLVTSTRSLLIDMKGIGKTGIWFLKVMRLADTTSFVLAITYEEVPE
jgi:hypothetical protein